MSSRTGGARERPTLEMVAAAAGVSRGTASRALNRSPNVSPHALAAVEQAAQSLGYRPNLAARSLVLGRSESVGLVISETDERLFTDPFFAAIVRGAHAALLGTGTQLVLALAQSDEERDQLVRFAAGRHLDGVLLISMHGEDPLLLSLAQADIPVVVAGRVDLVDPHEHGEPLRTPPWWVDSDNRAGARVGTEHLLGLGRRNVVTITGPMDMSVGRDRLEGWADALGRNASVDDPHVAQGDFSEESGRRAMQHLLARVPQVDGVFAANDLMALGALDALRSAGKSVPDDVAVVGFDDIALAARSDPALTTVAQPIDEMGRRMARMLLQRVRGEAVEQPHVVLPTTLVVRGSA